MQPDNEKLGKGSEENIPDKKSVSMSDCVCVCDAHTEGGGKVRVKTGEKEEGEIAQAKERARIHHLDPPGCFSTCPHCHQSPHAFLKPSYKGLWCETKIRTRGHYLIPSNKINSKWTKGINLKYQIIKALEENSEECFLTQSWYGLSKYDTKSRNNKRETAMNLIDI